MPGFDPTLVRDDIPCIGCGYNLRGLAPSGRCPECNGEVARSFHGDLLRFADPDWLKRVTSGFDVLLWGTVWSIAVISALFVANASGMTLGPGTPSAVLTPIQLALLVWPVCNLIAVFRITTEEPRVSMRDEGVDWRTTIRTAACLGVVINAVFLMPAMQQAMSVGIVASLVGRACKIVTLTGELSYAEGFAARIPDRRLARATSSVKWGFAIVLGGSLAITCVLGVYTWLTTGSPRFFGSPSMQLSTTNASDFRMRAAFFLGAMTGLAKIALTIWAFRLLLRYRKAFRMAIAAHPPPPV